MPSNKTCHLTSSADARKGDCRLPFYFSRLHTACLTLALYLLPTSVPPTRCAHSALGHHFILGIIHHSTAQTPGLVQHRHRYYYIKGRGTVCRGSVTPINKLRRRGSFPCHIQESPILSEAQFLGKMCSLY